MITERTPRARHLVDALQLAPHPEGGHFREIHRSADVVTPADGRGTRAALTTIYFLLDAGEQSRWHRVTSDEVWHLYEGALELLEMDAGCTTYEQHRLDAVGAHDGTSAPVHVVRAGRWQAARPLGGHALVGCTVAPGFDFADFRMLADDATRAALVRQRWPDAAELL